MLDAEAVILGELERLSPLPIGAVPDWLDVLRRVSAGSVRATGRNPHSRLVLVGVLMGIVCVIAAAAFATGLADRFGAWVSGNPGRPAPADLQKGFEGEN